MALKTRGAQDVGDIYPRECAPWVGTLTLPGEALKEDLDAVLGQPSESHPGIPPEGMEALRSRSWVWAPPFVGLMAVVDQNSH